MAAPLDDDWAPLSSVDTKRPPLLDAFVAIRPLEPVPVAVESACWPKPATDVAVALAAPSAAPAPPSALAVAVAAPPALTLVAVAKPAPPAPAVPVVAGPPDPPAPIA